MPRSRMCPRDASWRGKSISRVIAADSADHSKAFRCSLAGEFHQRRIDWHFSDQISSFHGGTWWRPQQQPYPGVDVEGGMAPELTKWSTNFTLETLQDTRGPCSGAPSEPVCSLCRIAACSAWRVGGASGAERPRTTFDQSGERPTTFQSRNRLATFKPRPASRWRGWRSY